MGDVHRLIVGVADPQPARDLLGGVVILEALLDHPAKLATELELRRPRPPRAAQGLAVCGVGAIAPTPQRSISRAIVVWERPSARAMARAECPRAIAREISSRSSKLKHLSGRRRALGRMPPVRARWLLTLPRGRPSRRPISRSLSPRARSPQIPSLVASLRPKPLGITAPPSLVSESLTLPGGAAVV